MPQSAQKSMRIRGRSSRVFGGAISVRSYGGGMDDHAMRRRLADASVGRLATASADARPHVVPCCFVLQVSTVFTAVDAKPKTTSHLQRLRNIEENPAVSLIVDHYEDDWAQLWWVRVDGSARVLREGRDCNAALDLLAAKYEQYRVTRPPGPVIALDIDRWRAWP